MIELYIPRKKIYMNQDNTIINDKGIVLYEYRSSLFQGKLSLFQDNRLLYTSDRIFSFISRYDIKRHGETICKVIKKWTFWHAKFSITSESGSYSIVGKPYIEDFQIYNGDLMVLSISGDTNKTYNRIIQVDETNVGFLLILMFTLIILAQADDST